MGLDGVVRQEEVAAAVNETHSMVITFDGMWSRSAFRYPTSDIIVADGAESLPPNWNRPQSFKPQNGAAQGFIESDRCRTTRAPLPCRLSRW